MGTNASYDRKITGMLKKKGIIDSKQGIGDFRLMIKPEGLALYMIYRAIYETDDVHVVEKRKKEGILWQALAAERKWRAGSAQTADFR